MAGRLSNAETFLNVDFYGTQLEKGKSKTAESFHFARGHDRINLQAFSILFNGLNGGLQMGFKEDGRKLKVVMNERIVKLLIESFPKILLPGLKMTIPLTVIAFSIAMVIAVIAAMIQYARIPVLRQIMRFYVWVVRGTPLLVQLFVVFYGLPSLGILLDPFPAAVIVFSINEGAYCAETMRAALESVPGGQMEAGYCVGMSYLQVMRRIVLPQALRTAFPPLSNSLIAMVKDTSLAANITVTEMFMATQKLVAYYYEPMALYIEVGVIYLLFSTVLTWLQRWGEKKLSAYGAQKE